MSVVSLRARPRPATRRWCLPPALLSDPSTGELIPGIRILHEHDEATAMLLWSSYRDVALWADTPAHERETLFRSSTDAAGALLERSRLSPAAVDALRVLFGVSGGEGPPAVCVAWACGAIAEWAAARGAVATAIGFAQAAAFVVPDDAQVTLEAGRLAARLGTSTAGAETWLRRATALARRARNSDVYTRALLELAWLRLQSAPEVGGAAALFQRAIRAARRGGRTEVRALAHHGLARTAMARGDYAFAATETRTALRMLRRGTGNPHFLGVVLDHAEALLLGESPSAAAAALRRFLPAFTMPRDRVRALTLLVRTAGSDGAPPVAEVWHDAHSLLGSLGESEEAARGFLELARAAAETGYDAQAENAARRALAIARRIHAEPVAQECASLLDQLRTRSSVRHAYG
ncbi:MAG TPA: hypothetical protein VEX86_03190 [Longimicrobium sp.]|nr:hypothetical protein [Longimicrobium sp.]